MIIQSSKTPQLVKSSQPSHRPLRWLALLAVFVLIVAACGGGESAQADRDTSDNSDNTSDATSDNASDASDADSADGADGTADSEGEEPLSDSSRSDSGDSGDGSAQTGRTSAIRPNTLADDADGSNNNSNENQAEGEGRTPSTPTTRSGGDSTDDGRTGDTDGDNGDGGSTPTTAPSGGDSDGVVDVGDVCGGLTEGECRDVKENAELRELVDNAEPAVLDSGSYPTGEPCPPCFTEKPGNLVRVRLSGGVIQEFDPYYIQPVDWVPIPGRGGFYKWPDTLEPIGFKRLLTHTRGTDGLPGSLIVDVREPLVLHNTRPFEINVDSSLWRAGVDTSDHLIGDRAVPLVEGLHVRVTDTATGDVWDYRIIDIQRVWQPTNAWGECFPNAWQPNFDYDGYKCLRNAGDYATYAERLDTQEYQAYETAVRGGTGWRQQRINVFWCQFGLNGEVLPVGAGFVGGYEILATIYPGDQRARLAPFDGRGTRLGFSQGSC